MGGQDYSSPIVAGGKLYFITRNGQCFVLGTGKAFKQLAVNRVNEQPEDFSASPAVGNGSLLLRSDKRLYCVMLP